MTDSTEHGGTEKSALRPPESDLHPADPVDHMRTAEYGRESAAARDRTDDGTPAPRETPPD